METVYVDGSKGEGGGQILRTSLALACITGKKLRIENIRAARRNPGLARQHLSCVEAARQICEGRCRGAALHSQTLDFEPGPVRGGDYSFDIGSAGSASLVIQTILPALFLADKPSTITVTGGTHNPWAPPFDFLAETFLPAIGEAGFHAGCKLVKHGFFPAGGGKIKLEIQPWRGRLAIRGEGIPARGPGDLPLLDAAGRPVPSKVEGMPAGRKAGTASPQEASGAIDFCQPDKERHVHGRIYTAKLPEHIAPRQKRLLCQCGLYIRKIEHVEVTDSDGPGNCVMIRLVAASGLGNHIRHSAGPLQRLPGGTTIFTAFGERGKPSEKVVGEVAGLAKDFLDSGAAIDHFVADQLLIYMAISKAGTYTTNDLSTHLTTNSETIKQFLPVDFKTEIQDRIYRISCLSA